MTNDNVLQDHCDFSSLQSLLWAHCTQDLVDTTHSTHYELYRRWGSEDYLSDLQLDLLMINKSLSLLPGRDCWLVAALVKGPQSLCCRGRRRPGNTARSWRGMKRQKLKLRGIKGIFREF